MKVEKNRKLFYWLFKVSAIVISCILPIWAVCEKFPIWSTSYGANRSFGVGSIIILIVLAIVFRKTVFNFLSDKLKLKYAPPIAVWLTALIVCYILIYIGNFLRDLTTVLWMGVVGCALGTLLTFVAENFFGDKENSDDRT